jgi:hypothetical protein
MTFPNYTQALSDLEALNNFTSKLVSECKSSSSHKKDDHKKTDDKKDDKKSSKTRVLFPEYDYTDLVDDVLATTKKSTKDKSDKKSDKKSSDKKDSTGDIIMCPSDLAELSNISQPILGMANFTA